ncbi:unnamed protein product, partial [Amoebophrya sp. A25]
DRTTTRGRVHLDLAAEELDVTLSNSYWLLHNAYTLPPREMRKLQDRLRAVEFIYVKLNLFDVANMTDFTTILNNHELTSIRINVSTASHYLFKKRWLQHTSGGDEDGISTSKSMCEHQQHASAESGSLPLHGDLKENFDALMMLASVKVKETWLLRDTSLRTINPYNLKRHN